MNLDRIERATVVDGEPADQRLSLRACPICHARQVETLSAFEFPLFEGTPISGKVDAVGCHSCGFVFYDTPSVQSDFDDFYRSHYLIRSYGLRDRHPAESAYLEETAKILMRGGVDPSAFTVDVGSGPGSFLLLLRAAGFSDLMGVELCEEYVEEMAQQHIPSRVGSAANLNLGGRLADCLIYKNIFEHFLDFDVVLDEIEARLAPGGHVFVEVPDAAHYGDYAGHSPLGYFTLEHINHFDPVHLHTLFERRGFVTVLEGTRMLDIAERYPVPIQHGLFRRAEGGGRQQQDDFGLMRTVRSWLARQARFESPALDSLRESGIPVHVWGMSYRTLAWLGMSPLKDCQIASFLDSDRRKQERRLLDRPIQDPSLLQRIGNDEAVVIGVGPSSSAMAAQLKNGGFKGIVVTLD